MLVKKPDGLMTRSPGSIQIGQWGSDIFVLNTDTKTQDSGYADPVTSAANASLNTKAYLIDVTAGTWSYLDLWHYFVGTAPVTALVMRVYGFVGMNSVNTASRRLLPYDIDPVAYSTGNLNSACPGLWIPLSDPSNGQTDLTFTSAAALVGASSEPVYSLSPKRTVALLGCSRVMALVRTAADTITAGMCAGRLLAA